MCTQLRRRTSCRQALNATSPTNLTKRQAKRKFPKQSAIQKPNQPPHRANTEYRAQKLQPMQTMLQVPSSCKPTSVPAPPCHKTTQGVPVRLPWRPAVIQMSDFSHSTKTHQLLVSTRSCQAASLTATEPIPSYLPSWLFHSCLLAVTLLSPKTLRLRW